MKKFRLREGESLIQYHLASTTWSPWFGSSTTLLSLHFKSAPLYKYQAVSSRSIMGKHSKVKGSCDEGSWFAHHCNVCLWGTSLCLRSQCSLPERAVQWHKLLLRSQTLKAMIPHLNVKVSLLIVSVPLLICHWELFADLLWISNSVHIKQSVHYTVINHLMVSRNKRKLFSSECCWKSSEWVILCFDCFIFWMSSNFIIVVCCVLIYGIRTIS